MKIIMIRVFLTTDDVSDKDPLSLMSLKSEVRKWDLVFLAEGFFR